MGDWFIIQLCIFIIFTCNTHRRRIHYNNNKKRLFVYRRFTSRQTHAKLNSPSCSISLSSDLCECFIEQNRSFNHSHNVFSVFFAGCQQTYPLYSVHDLTFLVTTNYHLHIKGDFFVIFFLMIVVVYFPFVNTAKFNNITQAHLFEWMNGNWNGLETFSFAICIFCVLFNSPL